MTGTALADRCAELSALLPALASALSRDQAPGRGHGQLSVSGVVNPDVLAAMLTVSREVPAATAMACEAAGEPWHPRPLGTCLRALPRLHDRLDSLGLRDEAGRTDTAVARWLRVTKLALGLRKPDMPIGFDCPWCTEPSPLLAVGAEGFLRAGMTVEWQSGALIRCPACGESWAPAAWLHLGRLLLESA